MADVNSTLASFQQQQREYYDAEVQRKQQEQEQLAQNPSKVVVVTPMQSQRPNDNRGGILRGSIPAPSNNTGNGLADARPIQASPAEALSKMMLDINTINDPTERLNKLYQIKSSYEGTINKFKADAYKQSELELGVPQLKQALASAEQLDRSDPRYNEFRTDSGETADVRRQYQTALSASASLADKHFTGNEEVGRLKGLIEPFLASQQRIYEKLSMKQDSVDAREEDMRLTLGNAPIDLSRIVAPEADPVKHAVANIRNKDFYQAALAMNEPQQLVPLAMEKNSFARAALIDKNATMLAGDKNKNPGLFEQKKMESIKLIDGMQSLVDNQAKFVEAVNRVYPKAKADKFLMSMPTDNSAESVQARKNIRMNFASEWAASENEAVFFGNVNSWSNRGAFDNPDSTLSKLYTSAKTKLGTNRISFDSLVGSINELPEEQRAAARAELGQVAEQALKGASGGLVGQFSDGVNLQVRLNAVARQSLLDKFSKTLDATMGMIPAVLPGGLGTIESGNVQKTIMGVVK